MTEDKLKGARDQGQAQFDSIREMVERMQDEGADESDREAAREEMQQDALSVQVRSGWYQPGSNPPPPEEFKILLCTGGPACRLVGKLDDHGEPESVTMQVQDWFTPWTDFRPKGDHEKVDAVLMAYAQTFYFGEG